MFEENIITKFVTKYNLHERRRLGRSRKSWRDRLWMYKSH